MLKRSKHNEKKLGFSELFLVYARVYFMHSFSTIEKCKLFRIKHTTILKGKIFLKTNTKLHFLSQVHIFLLEKKTPLDIKTLKSFYFRQYVQDLESLAGTMSFLPFNYLHSWFRCIISCGTREKTFQR